MSAKYLYLTINILSILFPFLFSFYSKANFSKKWRYLALAIALPATFFLFWDEWFTRMGIWGFNPYYITGYTLFSLPFEEVLFFFCIPYACVFTYEAVNYLIKWRMDVNITNLITDIVAGTLFFIGVLYFDHWYTATTFILTSIFLNLHRWVWKKKYLGKFYVAFLFILIPFFLVNGILTGSFIEGEIVWYNNAETLGIRLGTIPLEDTFYGMLLLLMNISIFEYLQE